MGQRVERRPVLAMDNLDVRKDLTVGDDLDVGGNTTGAAGGAITPSTGVALTFQRKAQLQHVRLTLTALAIAVAAADDFGSASLGILPDTNLRIVAVEVDVTLTKDGVEIVAATNLAAAIGTAAASATTLDSTMADVLSSQALTADEDPAVLQAFETPDLDVADAADNELFLNVSSADISGDGSVEADGTIDLYYFDLGNVTS